MPVIRSLLPALLLLIGLPLTGCGGAPTATDPAPEEGAEQSSVPTIEDAIAHFRAGDLEATEKTLQAVLAADTSNSRGWSFLGQVRVQREDLDGALEAYGKAVEVNPEAYNALFGQASVRAKKGDVDEALGTLGRLRATGKVDFSQITLDPNFTALHDDPRFQALLMGPEEFENPFVEDTTVIHEWVGEAAGDEYGWIARNIGDVDGDGVADVTTSAPSKAIPTDDDPEGALAGRVYAYSGKGGELLWTASGNPGDNLGRGIEAAGDVNADGVPDVVAGAPGANRVFVYSGRDGTVLLTLEGEDGENFGAKVSDVGDVDGDGHADLMVGAPQNDAAGTDAGRALIVSGKSGKTLVEWRGEVPGARLGASGAGAVVDGRTFLVVGAPDAGEGKRGRVYVYAGLDAEPAFVIDSDAQGSEMGGMFVSVVGDVDGDGVPDIYASDWAHHGNGPQTGKVVVHSGADGSELFALVGETSGDSFGIGPADAGDVDGDGHADLIVGAWQQDNAAPAGGKVYLYSGKDQSLLRAWTCRVMGDTFGFDATGMGDVDGDGSIDFLLTSAWSAVSGPKSGRMFIVSGG